MTTTYTPGPWFARDEWIYARQDRGAIFVAMATYKGATAIANARLIAAAPELLDALRYATEWIEEETEAPFPEGRAAIAKARGETK